MTSKFINNNLSDYIKIYDDVLDKNMCELLTLCFDVASDKHEVIKNDKIHFTQLNLTYTQASMSSQLVSTIQGLIKRYKEDLQDETSYWPKNRLALEELRVKRYNGGTDECFGDHVDVGDYNSARRYLAFLFYLNDNFTGGETLFLPDKLIKPKTGTVVIFPPTWQYPHAGLKVKTGTKYIMSTYLHYT